MAAGGYAALLADGRMDVTRDFGPGGQEAGSVGGLGAEEVLDAVAEEVEVVGDDVRGVGVGVAEAKE